MGKDFLPPIGSRGSTMSLGIPLGVGLVAVLAVAAVGYGIRFYWGSTIETQILSLERSLDDEKGERNAAKARIRALETQVAGLSAVNGVELIYGGSGKALPKMEVKLPYKRQGSVVVHATREKSLYYFTANDETLGEIASHPRTLGAWYLWPILRDENKLKGRGGTKLPPSTLLKIPTRLGDWRLRSATTTAGAPDAVRNKVFEQSGID